MRSLFLVAALLAAAPAAHAATEAAFTQPAFEAAEHAGQPILVHITASWCPTCAAQRPILSELFAKPEYKDLQVFDVDFDTQKNVVRDLGATMQSTLIAFHGADEKARSAGDTNPASIGALVAKANQ